MAGYVRTQSTCGSVIHERGLERGTRRIRSRNSIGYAWRGVVRNIEPLVLKVAVCIGGGGYRHVRVVWGAFAEDQRDGLVRLPSLAGYLDDISRKIIVLLVSNKAQMAQAVAARFPELTSRLSACAQTVDER